MWLESLWRSTSRQTEWRDGEHDEAIQGEKEKVHSCEDEIHWRYYSTVVRSRPACDKHIVGGKYCIVMVLTAITLRLLH